MDYLLVGHGADELIDLVMRLFIGPGDVVLNCPPTFGMYPFDAAVNGARVLSLPRRADFSLDVEGIVAAVADQPRAKLLFVASPNNPDGGLLGDDDLRHLLELAFSRGARRGVRGVRRAGAQPHRVGARA